MEEEKRKNSNAMKVSATQMASEKVASTVATFLYDDNDSVQVPTTQTEPEKVASTVATFLNGGNVKTIYKDKNVILNCFLSPKSGIKNTFF